jgi:hypothetical protein
VLPALLTSCVGTSQISAGYYNIADTSSPQTLQRTLREIIDDHQRPPYTSTRPDTWNVIAPADEDPGNTANVITTYNTVCYERDCGSSVKGKPRNNHEPTESHQ